jgi:excisionase family DNA binding protein
LITMTAENLSHGGTEPLLLRPSEGAFMLGISRSRVYEMIARGELPGVMRLGRTIRISRRVLEAWIQRETGGDALLGTEAVPPPQTRRS